MTSASADKTPIFIWNNSAIMNNVKNIVESFFTSSASDLAGKLRSRERISHHEQ
jgi:hypothetical protein